MKRTWTIIGVKDVPRSFTWYQTLFGQAATAPEHPDFGQLLDSDGTVLLCLHEWGVEDHPPLMSPEKGIPGNGLLLFFRVDDFDLCLKRARTLVARLAEDPHVNPNTRTEEFSLRDPDGYYVSISALTGRKTARLTSLAPQFLVDDLQRSIRYYEKIGFTFDEPWDGFYAIGRLDGLEVHLKEAPRNQAERQWRRDNEHLDASAGVDGIEALYEQCVARGVAIIKPLAATAWGTKDFYIEDPDGYIIAFGGRPAAP